MQIEHKKNTAYYLAVPIVDKANPDQFLTGDTPAVTGYSKDGAGAWTNFTPGDILTEIGTTGVYEMDLTNAEMNHDQVLLKVTSTNGGDTAFMFDMRGSVDCLDAQLGDYVHGGAAAELTLTAASYNNFKATGFSTFNPASDKVFLGDGAHGGEAATITLSDYSNFQADVSGLSTFNPATDDVTLADGVTHGGPDAEMQLNGLTIQQQTVNKAAVIIEGNGTGPGLQISGGTGGDGVTITAGTVSAGINITTGALSRGIVVDSNQEAISLTSAASATATVLVTNNGGGSGYGIDIASAGGGMRIVASGTSTPGITISQTSGSGFSGLAINSTGGPGVLISGGGAAAGLQITAGATGSGVIIAGGATSGDGFVINASNGQNFNGDGSAAVLDAFFQPTITELTAAPSATAPMKDQIQWQYHLARWARLTDANDNEDRVYNSANDTVISEADINDAANQFTRGPYRAVN